MSILRRVIIAVSASLLVLGVAGCDLSPKVSEVYGAPLIPWEWEGEA